MEFHYQDLELEIRPHADGYELEFGLAPNSHRETDLPPRFALRLTREGLQTLSRQIQDALENE